MPQSEQCFLGQITFTLRQLLHILKSHGLTHAPVVVMQSRQDYETLLSLTERAVRNQTAGYPSNVGIPKDRFMICGVAFVPPPSQTPVGGI